MNKVLKKKIRNSKLHNLIISVLLVFIISGTLFPARVLAAMTGTSYSEAIEQMNNDGNVKGDMYKGCYVAGNITHTGKYELSMNKIPNGFESFFEVRRGATFTIEGDLTISATYSGTAFLVRETGTVIIAAGESLTLTGESSIDGNIINYGTLNIENRFTYQAAGTITNYGTINDSGTIENRGKIENHGEINGVGTIENDGTFYNYNDKTNISSTGNNSINKIDDITAILDTKDD